MRCCFVHIGTHKTGSKSIQLALSSHWEELQSRKFLYPATGRPPEAPHGHHNLAWEVSGDSRFRKEHGSLENLLDEIRGSMHDVILSSEDFECSICRPERFSEFIRTLQEDGFDVKLLIYFRNQIEYAKSLYLQLLPFGLDRPFGDFLNEILEYGFFKWRDWTFFFCYRDFLGRLEVIEGTAIMVRSFAEARDSLISDYLSNFGLKPSDIGVSENIFVNKQVAMDHAIRMFYQNRLGRALADSENQAINSLIEALSGRPLELSPSSRLRIIRTFADDNEYLVRKYHIARFENMQPDKANIEESGGNLWMESIFSANCDLAFQKIVWPD